MRNRGLATDYVRRATVRLQAIEVLQRAASWADVVRESQEAVELALKGLLRSFGIDPPRLHDVSEVLRAERERLPASVHGRVDRMAPRSRGTCAGTGSSRSTARRTSFRPSSTARRTPVEPSRARVS